MDQSGRLDIQIYVLYIHCRELINGRIIRKPRTQNEENGKNKEIWVWRMENNISEQIQ